MNRGGYNAYNQIHNLQAIGWEAFARATGVSTRFGCGEQVSSRRNKRSDFPGLSM